MMRKKPVLIFALAILVFSVWSLIRPDFVFGNFSAKKGAGMDWKSPMRNCNTTDINNQCVVNFMNKVESLGVTWLYQWGLIDPRPAWLDPSIEFVPMIFAHGTNNDSSYPQGMLDRYTNWTRENPNSHWLIWNEPDLYTSAVPDPHSQIPPLIAAKIYKPLYDAIKLGNSNAKVIIGGLYEINFAADGWVNTFRNEYKRLNGEFPPLDGWAFHYYGSYSSSDFRTKMYGVRDWLANNGYAGKEFWLTEFGNLSSNEIGLQMLKDQQEWLETEPFVTKYAFFYTGVEERMKGNLLTGSLSNLGAAQLSSLGLEYASHPINSTPACPGDINADRAVNQTDLALLNTCYNPFDSPTAGCQIADLNHDNLVNALDYSLLLTRWGSCP